MSKHILGRFLSRLDQYSCNQSCNSKSSMQPHSTVFSRQQALASVQTPRLDCSEQIPLFEQIPGNIKLQPLI